MCLSSFRKIKTKNKNPTFLSIFFRSIIWEPEKFFCMALQVLLFFGQIPLGAKIGHGGSPSSRNFFFRPEGYSDKPNA